MPTRAINDTGVKYVYDKLDTKKADKVASATNGNLAGLNASGNLTDSGWASDKTTTSISGNPISITGLKSNQLAVNPVITFEPIQDLHGQSNPYPAGGSKNKLPMTVEDIKAASTSGTWSGNKYTYNNVEYTLLVDNANNIIGIGVKTLSGGASAASALNIYSISTDAQYILNGCPSGGNTDTYALKVYSYTDSGSGVTIPSGISSKTVYIYVNAGVTINTIFYPMLRLATESDATFVPSSNISPISGYDKIEVLSCGKNLCDNSKNKVGGYYNLIGQWVESSGYASTGLIPVAPNTQYRGHIYGKNGNALNDMVWTKWSDETTCEGQVTDAYITTGANTRFVRLRNYSNESSYITNSNFLFALEKGNTSSTTYPAYHKTTDLSENLPQTVYGGSLDVRTGKLLSKWVKATITSISGSKPNYYASVAVYPDTTKNLDIVCDKMATASSYGGSGVYINNNRAIMFVTSAYESAADLLAAFGGSVDVCYAVATPIEIQLTPHEISLLKDYAYVSTNGTNITFDYHNGEIATLGDVAQVGQTIDKVEDDYKRIINNRCRISRSYQLSSNNPIVLPCNAYGSYLLFGFLQGIGARFYAVTLNAGAIAITNLMDGNSVPTSSASMNFVYDSTSHTLTISSAYAQTSLVSIIGDGYIIK